MTDKKWNYLIQNELFTEAELQLVTDVAGYSCETLDQAWFARYGYDFDGIKYEFERGNI